MPFTIEICSSLAIQFMGAAGMLNLGNLNLRVIILSTEAIQTYKGLLSAVPNKYKTTPLVCNETTDTNRPRSQCSTVVRNCYKGDVASQWEIAIFGHLGL